MAVTALSPEGARADAEWSARRKVALVLFGLAIALAIARPLLPAWMNERPDDSGPFPFADRLLASQLEAAVGRGLDRVSGWWWRHARGWL